MNDIEKLLAAEDIKKIVAKRIRTMDTKDWVEYDSCHTPDATSNSYAEVPEENRPPGGIARGKTAILEMIRKIVDGKVKVTSVHHAHAPEIDIVSPTEARGIWAFEDHFWWQNGGVEEHLHGYGYYHETYRKLDGRWLISSRVVTRQRVDATPGFATHYAQERS